MKNLFIFPKLILDSRIYHDLNLNLEFSNEEAVLSQNHGLSQMTTAGADEFCSVDPVYEDEMWADYLRDGRTESKRCHGRPGRSAKSKRIAANREQWRSYQEAHIHQWNE